MVMDQLQSLGVMDTVRIRQETYPVRMTYRHFLLDYYPLHSSFRDVNHRQEMEGRQEDWEKLSE